MAAFRVDTVQDPATGLFSIEIFHPEDPNKLLVASAPTYRSHEQAMADMVGLISHAWPDKTVWSENEPFSK